MCVETKEIRFDGYYKQMDSSSTDEIATKCRYCNLTYNENIHDGLKCAECHQEVHLNCLKRGAVPGGLIGDVFFQFTCYACSSTSSEHFIRQKMPWLQVILLVLYHMQARSPGLARKGYFHWKIHIASFIDKNWDIIFRKDFKRKKKWMGTVSGTLSHYSPLFFKSGTSLFNEQGWWTLTYSTFSPYVVVQLNSELMVQKQRMKELKIVGDDLHILKAILVNKPYASEDVTKMNIPEPDNSCNPTTTVSIVNETKCLTSVVKRQKLNHFKMLKTENKRHKHLLPTIDSLANAKNIYNIYKDKLIKKKKANGTTVFCRRNVKNIMTKLNHKRQQQIYEKSIITSTSSESPEATGKLSTKFLDPMCHYNTSLTNLNFQNGSTLRARLMGGIRNDPILSPYTWIYLKPYIRRDTSISCSWLQLMDEIKSKVNRNNVNWVLPPRSPIEFSYVQPEHIPAINSLCNQFFWTGIDLSDTLQYPDFSCVVVYRKLIIGFAFVIPDVNVNESYLSFIFTRPGWRNAGIANFMLYHLIQTSIGRDITLHVSISNPALFLYQKFGFKVEYVVLDFYDRYMSDDTRESKHAFFCRLER